MLFHDGIVKNYFLRFTIVFFSAFVLFNCLIVYHFFLIDPRSKDIKQYEYSQPIIQSLEMELFCSKVRQRIKDEKRNNISNIFLEIQPPNFDMEITRQLQPIVYRYSDWDSSPELPRRLSPCEHQIYTELLSILDHFFRRHSISYMMVDGTLVGSYTHHDFLPWDDDVDLRASSKDRSRIYTLLHQDLDEIIGISHINDEYGSYDKFYFPWTPRAGKQEWSYPFIDLSYFDENSTHIWRANYDNQSINDCSVLKENIFPLVWRPFGEIWLPGPRQPVVIFELHRWINMSKLYYAGNFSHKYHQYTSFMYGHARPEQLFPYYPWVQRYCLKTQCIEELVAMNKNTIITKHTVPFEKYRTTLVFNPTLENRTCFL